MQNKYVKHVLEAWPVYAFIGGALGALTFFYFEGKVQAIADSRIAMQVPVSADFVALKSDISTLQNDLGDAEDSVESLSIQLTRVEGKIDDLYRIMVQRSQ